MNNLINTRRLLAFAIASLFIAGPGFAKDKGEEGGGQGKGNKHAQKHEAKADKHEAKADKHKGKGGDKQSKAEKKDVKVGAYFDDQHRSKVSHYYTTQYGDGKRCPPGLAKKNNGCMPPGQAKKWNVGQPLPAGVAVYSVPQPVLVYLPPVPVGYKYVGVAGDILLVAIGSQMVVDGISGLMR